MSKTGPHPKGSSYIGIYREKGLRSSSLLGKETESFANVICKSRRYNSRAAGDIERRMINFSGLVKTSQRNYL